MQVAMQAEPNGLLRRLWAELSPWIALLTCVLLSPGLDKALVLTSLFTGESLSKREVTQLVTDLFEVSVVVMPSIVIHANHHFPVRQLALSTYQNILKTQKLAFVEYLSRALLEDAPAISKKGKKGEEV